MSYSFGELTHSESTTEKSSSQIIKLNTFISSKWQDLIAVAFSDDIVQEALIGTSSRSYGKLIHKILSEIESTEDITNAIYFLTISGMLDIKNIKIIEDTIINVVSHPDLQKFFDPGQVIKNETEIMLSNGEVVRPDRVVIQNDVLTIIDYKTGEEKKQDYDQMKKYYEAFSGLGYKEIATKIVYICDIIRVVDGLR